MLNYETLLSSYDDKLTLMQWLKKVEEALKDASAVAFKVNQRGNATLTFSVEFEDGSELETGPIVLQQGESVVSAAIVGGHLKLTLSNGDVLDAGDLGGVSSFSINASQHLIVHYQNGTTQDLGAIFAGNVTISGDLVVTGNVETDSMTPRTGSAITIDGNLHISDGNVELNDGHVSTPILTSQNAEIEAQKPVIEVMTGYAMATGSVPNLTKTDIYGGIVKNGNKLTLAYAFKAVRTDTIPSHNNPLVEITIPASIGNALFVAFGTLTLARNKFLCTDLTNINGDKEIKISVYKMSNTLLRIFSSNDELNNLTLNDEYYIRAEVTFLLSNNLLA